nr:RNA-dependent RNA polymerase [Ustilaginoidea virens RNA virus 16]
MSALTSGSERAAHYGAIGAAALRYLTENGFDFEAYEAMTSSQQYVVTSVSARYAARLTASCPVETSLLFGVSGSNCIPVYRHPCLGVFISLCGNRSPVQVCTSDSTVVEMLNIACSSLKPTMAAVKRSPNSAKPFTLAELVSSKRVRECFFPYKKHHLAATKANIHLDSLLAGLRTSGFLPQSATLIYMLAGRASDDQVCAALMQWFGLLKALGTDKATLFAAASILEPEAVKGLGTALKALGMGGNAIGSMLIEGQCLLGRGVGEVDLKAEALMRCEEGWVERHVIDADPVQLRAAIRAILQEELGGRLIEFPDLDSFWDSRWQWCVNGAHTTAVDAKAGVDSKSAFTGLSRYYRRMFAEAVDSEPISGWDGDVSVGVSAKLEHGKTRVIFACDTLSYFAFEHLLGPVAAAWQQRRVVLDPGKFGSLGMCGRVNGLRGRGGVNVMLDYDDFNSHHSLQTQKILFEETVAFTNYPKELGEKLVNSFESMYMRTPGGLIPILGTLMSGHRGTTYINSVLNAAYIRCALGQTEYNRFGSLHVGDDVYMCTPVIEDAVSVLEKCRAYGCRMNTSKQSVGTEAAEFLRMAITPHSARGYLARAVASAVSGNWTSEFRLGPRECLTSMVQTTRSLINRSGGADYATLLTPCVASLTRLGAKKVRLLLSGEVALGEGPSYGSSSYLRRFELQEDVATEVGRRLRKEWPEHATTAYLSRAAAPVERRALEIAEVSVKSAMLDSSYRKALASDIDPKLTPMSLVERRLRQLRGAEDAVELLKKPAPRGVLAKYPLLQLVKNRLKPRDLRILLRLVGGDFYARDLNTVAWGAPNCSKVIRGVLPYSDASSLSSRTNSGVIYCTYPVHH